MNNKWQMNRAGLLNFWYYDEEIFPFSNGKLLLRGNNGSGKSVTMQSFLPVLLDGKTSPDRLDPFGSRARRMEDYLLGEKEIVDRDERTGYLFMEFKREQVDQFITIGIGLQAKRHKQMKFWGFVITDNRRIGIDFELYKLENHAGEQQKIPRSRIELENIIQDGGHLVQTKTEYMKLVNKYLFGFETIEAYEDLIKLLIQLRSPKLSKDFRPSVIYEILEAALPPLSDEDLRHLSDTIEQMDQTKQQIEQLDREAAAIKSLNKVYKHYNIQTLTDQATDFLQSVRRLRKEEKALKQMTSTRNELEEAINQLGEDLRTLKIDQETNKQKEGRLKSHKVWNLAKERSDKLEELKKVSEDLQKKHQRLSKMRTQENQLLTDKDELEVAIAKLKENMENMLMDLANDAEEASFHEQHELNLQDFNRHLQENFSFNVWSEEVIRHLHTLEKIEKNLQAFEIVRERHQEKEKELATQNQALDMVMRELEDLEQLFEEDKQEKLKEIYEWVAKEEWVELSEEAEQTVARNIYHLYELADYEEVKAPFQQAYLHYLRETGQELSKLEHEKAQWHEVLQEQENELEEWRRKKDPEMEIDPLTEEAREQLTEENIPFLPFYQTVEFQDHVEDRVRKRIEAALLDSGLLGALVVNTTIAVKHDRVIQPNPQMFAYTLADYLQPDLEADSPLAPTHVMDILSSIIVGEAGDDSVTLSVDGHYELGLLKGHALPVEEVRFIGRTARQRYRAEKIAELAAQIEKTKDEIEVVKGEIWRIEQLQLRAKASYDTFPNDEDLREAFKQIEQMNRDKNHLSKLVTDLSKELREINERFTELRQAIHEQTRELNIEKNLQAYQAAISTMRQYQEDLWNLGNQHVRFLNERDRLQANAERLDEIEETKVELQGEVNVVEDTEKTLQQSIEQIDELLDSQGMADIQAEIEAVQRLLHKVDYDLREKDKEKYVKESELQRANQDLEVQEKQVTFWHKMNETWQMTLEQELQRGFFQEEKDKQLEDVAKQMVKTYGQAVSEKERTSLHGRLTDEYYKQHGNLMEYRPSNFQTTMTTPEWMNDWFEEEDYLPFIRQWEQKSTRQLIELDYQGKQVSPVTIQEKIELEQDRQESFLDKQDRELYEEILFNTVGQKLRARIRRAEQWIAKMKNLMEDRDTSSGLSFSIRWRPRTADADTELDTVELVHILRQDSKLLKEEDIEKITTHFRSKIAKAKELVGHTTEMQTLLQVLKEVLDYRKWFSFVLYFQREGETRRELTNNQFYKFSGGEKAMAMYIPLFTACYSRYLEASPEAPYIISLDEAFAGVDENNIREMFEIVEQLDFNYIMNSQILYGDYDTVKELSISELIRPKNAGYVSVIRYQWDGNKLTMEKPEAEKETTSV